MANRNLRKIKGTVAQEGLILLNAAAVIAADASVAAANVGTPGTWSRVSAGKYRFVSTDKFTGPATRCFFNATVSAAAAVDLVPQITAVTCANGTLTVDVNLLAAAVATDPAAITTLYLTGWIKDSGVLP